jgi:broad specificity phosphatase PhoE
VIYLLTEPPNTLEAKGRVLGNYPAHWNNTGKRQLREICQPLKDKGVKFAYANDLDADALHIVADELHIPFSKEYGLRRFNAGRQHGGKLEHLYGILEQLIPKWRNNDCIPIRGGDSWRSVEKRLFKAVDRIIEKEECAVIVTDARTATLIVYREPKALVMNGEALKPSKIYVIGKKA